MRPASTNRLTVTASQVHTRAKAAIPVIPVTRLTAKLQAGYMPSGKTVAQRSTSWLSLGRSASAAISSPSQSMARHHKTSAATPENPRIEVSQPGAASALVILTPVAENRGEQQRPADAGEAKHDGSRTGVGLSQTDHTGAGLRGRRAAHGCFAAQTCRAGVVDRLAWAVARRVGTGCAAAARCPARVGNTRSGGGFGI